MRLSWLGSQGGSSVGRQHALIQALIVQLQRRVEEVRRSQRDRVTLGKKRASG